MSNEVSRRSFLGGLAGILGLGAAAKASAPVPGASTPLPPLPLQPSQLRSVSCSVDAEGRPTLRVHAHTHPIGRYQDCSGVYFSCHPGALTQAQARALMSLNTERVTVIRSTKLAAPGHRPWEPLRQNADLRRRVLFGGR